eukprot:1168177-Pyramimonas_sp.AAC.1
MEPDGSRQDKNRADPFTDIWIAMGSLAIRRHREFRPHMHAPRGIGALKRLSSERRTHVLHRERAT